ncbi:hypothetical protein ZIOFF_033530 [Zingiber officinale]|uniref:GIR1-like zinc ribbon domain-containing protein n=1 Tax=Zingiber officinale TaxID=94328 RepID=A0A8J5L7F0_ZINOF|nr:hypothetical protein ZIOFF_033530 [Zingiber officinale]
MRICLGETLTVGSGNNGWILNDISERKKQSSRHSHSSSSSSSPPPEPPLLITAFPPSLPSSVRALRLLPFPGLACGNGLPLYRPDRRIATELLSGRTPSYSVAAAQHPRCERREDHSGVELGDTPSLLLGSAARHSGAICFSFLPQNLLVAPLLDLNALNALASIAKYDVETDFGEIHYINWETGERTTADPRSAATASIYSSSYYCTDEEEASGTGSGKEGCEEEEDDDNGNGDTADPDEDESSGTGSGIETRDEEEDDDSTACSSGPSSTGDDRRTLVAAGCSACFMYLMVHNGTPACPKCGAALIHLGNCL